MKFVTLLHRMPWSFAVSTKRSIFLNTSSRLKLRCSIINVECHWGLGLVVAPNTPLFFLLELSVKIHGLLRELDPLVGFVHEYEQKIHVIPSEDSLHIMYESILHIYFGCKKACSWKVPPITTSV